MTEKVKIPFEGGMEEAEEVSIAPPGFFSGQFSFGDGNDLMVRVEMKSAFRLLHKAMPSGEPIYVTTMQVMSTLRREKREDLHGNA